MRGAALTWFTGAAELELLLICPTTFPLSYPHTVRQQSGLPPCAAISFPSGLKEMLVYSREGMSGMESVCDRHGGRSIVISRSE
jgi:hypothetical protein